MSKEKELGRIKANDLEGINWKDIVAIVIAQVQILMPIVIGAAIVMALLLFVIMKVWIR
ncbi:hypothetical protein [Clostridium sp.]|uniref:hypothetical protein n=1 Tax=Clostridium sp. TaxID=1506 RepID=UPI003D6CFB18